jgi:tetratricopeptide (TPR) repeat protein
MQVASEMKGTSQPRIGADPASTVFLMENHDEAYSIWRRLNHRARTLVHVDAHHDMWWITKPTSITIANFISLALQQDIVSEIYWVVPDASWANSRNRAHLLNHLNELQGTYPSSSGKIREEAERASVVLCDKSLTVCSLHSLPRLSKSVLLDVDIDFFIIPKVTYGRTEFHGPLPWCWPDGLMGALLDAEVSSDCVTIAYSIEGGYCPLKWKYLGNELQVRLCKPQHVRRELLEVFSRMRDAAFACQRQDWETALFHYQKCVGLWPGSAAPLYNLAQVLLHQGRIHEARQLHVRALANDPTYSTPYNSSGFHHCWSGRYRAARRGHRRALCLDPKNAAAYLGLAQISAHKRQWKEAERLFHQALEFDSRLVDAYRGLGRALAAQARYVDAADYLQKAFMLAANGCRPLAAPIITIPSEQPYDKCDLRHIIRTWGLRE